MQVCLMAEQHLAALPGFELYQAGSASQVGEKASSHARAMPVVMMQDTVEAWMTLTRTRRRLGCKPFVLAVLLLRAFVAVPVVELMFRLHGWFFIAR